MSLKIQDKNGHTVAVLKDDATEPEFVAEVKDKKESETEEKESDNDVNECST